MLRLQTSRHAIPKKHWFRMSTFHERYIVAEDGQSQLNALIHKRGHEAIDQQKSEPISGP
jgi:hypothetical protein